MRGPPRLRLLRGTDARIFRAFVVFGSTSRVGPGAAPHYNAPSPGAVFGICMRITIFGTGYVGLVTGTCLAEVGNDVICLDVDADKIARLERGEMPIFEPGLAELVAGNV